MKTFKKKKFVNMLRFGTLLLVLSGTGIYFSLQPLLPAVIRVQLPGKAFNMAPALIPFLVILGLFAAGIATLAAFSLFWREASLRRRSGMVLERFLQAADASTDLITVLFPSGQIEYVNNAVELATGYARNELINKRLSPRLPWYGDAELVRRMRETVLAGNEFVAKIDSRTREGATLTLQERVMPFRDAAGNITRMISTARDLTREQDLKDRIDYLDRYDPLTKLPNRRTLIDLLEKAVATAKEQVSISVLVLDIDRFNQLNDLCGAEAGDEILRQVSQRIRSAVSPADFVARTGNDEFVVVHVDSQKPILAGAVAQQLRSSLSQHMTAGGQDIVVTVSTGVAVYPKDGDDAWSLLKNADLALARAKTQGRNAIQFFDPEISARLKEFFFLEKRLFAALKNNEYLLQYQPYCDLRTMKVSGAEALIRWKNPDLGVVSPAKFIPSLEDTGMLIEVGRWILETACGQIKEWERMNRRFPVSVNLSLVQFRHQQLVGMVKDAINEFQVDPRWLTLEVTETVFMHDMDLAISILKRLKDVGVALSVDDFGTGYSSLSYIKKLPVDNLKIDISFVRDVTRDQDAASIITAITTLARGLNLKTIAEGVETEEQRNILHLLRCDMGQGYFFSRAVSPPEFEKLLV